jgi:hypothetical protein
MGRVGGQQAVQGRGAGALMADDEQGAASPRRRPVRGQEGVQGPGGLGEAPKPQAQAELPEDPQPAAARAEPQAGAQQQVAGPIGEQGAGGRGRRADQGAQRGQIALVLSALDGQGLQAVQLVGVAVGTGGGAGGGSEGDEIEVGRPGDHEVQGLVLPALLPLPDQGAVFDGEAAAQALLEDGALQGAGVEVEAPANDHLLASAVQDQGRPAANLGPLPQVARAQRIIGVAGGLAQVARAEGGAAEQDLPHLAGHRVHLHLDAWEGSADEVTSAGPVELLGQARRADGASLGHAVERGDAGEGVQGAVELAKKGGADGGAAQQHEAEARGQAQTRGQAHHLPPEVGRPEIALGGAALEAGQHLAGAAGTAAGGEVGLHAQVQGVEGLGQGVHRHALQIADAVEVIDGAEEGAQAAVAVLDRLGGLGRPTRIHDDAGM